MKSTEWASIILVATLSILIAFFSSSRFISNDEDRTAKLEQVVPVSGSIDALNPQVFSENSINLTQLVEIRESNSEQPFVD